MELFVSDLDGTLLNKNAELSVNTKNILNRLIEKGLKFTVATARTYASAGKILNGLNLELPIILMNGVSVFDVKSEKYCKVNYLDKDLCRKINNEKNKAGLDCFLYTIKNNEMMTYFERLSSKAMENFYNIRKTRYYKAFTKVNCFEEVMENVIYFTFIGTREMLLPFYEKIKLFPQLTITFYDDIYSENLWYLEVFSADASKKNAVTYIKEKFGFDKIYAFGDNTNDLPMFEVADRKYAVENANRIVLEKCDEVIGSNENDGVAEFLLKLKGK